MLFFLSDYDPGADEFYIYAKEPVSIEQGNDFVLQFMREDIVLIVEQGSRTKKTSSAKGGKIYAARPSMKIIPSATAEDRSAILLRLKVQNMDSDSFTAF